MQITIVFPVTFVLQSTWDASQYWLRTAFLCPVQEIITCKTLALYTVWGNVAKNTAMLLYKRGTSVYAQTPCQPVARLMILNAISRAQVTSHGRARTKPLSSKNNNSNVNLTLMMQKFCSEFLRRLPASRWSAYCCELFSCSLRFLVLVLFTI